MSWYLKYHCFLPFSIFGKQPRANKLTLGAVVVAQLVEQSLPTPEICSSNPGNSKFYLLSAVKNCIEKKKINKKRQWMAHFFKKWLYRARIAACLAIFNRRGLRSGHFIASFNIVFDGVGEQAADPLLAVVDEELAATSVDDAAVLLAEGLINVLDLLDEAGKLDGTFVQCEVLKESSERDA